MPTHRVLGALVATVMLTVACTGSDAAPTTTVAPTTLPPVTVATTVVPTTVADPGYRATITRTSYGVPHIVADDWGSLGFGQGYAFAQDRACTLLDQVVKVRGERAKWFGPGEGDANLTTDFAYRHLGLRARADAALAAQPPHVLDLVTGYAAGFDEAIAVEGAGGWCEGAPWVQPISAADLYAYLSDVVLFASSGNLIDQIGTAQPPAPAPPTSVTASSGAPASSDPTAVALSGDTTDMGSNGWALGRDVTGGGGIVLANPHFPWEGEKRLWESQLTLTTGELDVYGATLSGVPGVLIGFNDAVAWTHTVSAGYRMTLYQLALVPGSPTTYTYGDSTRQMTSDDITIDVLGADGTTSSMTRTMWSSHYGPMLQLPFGWTSETAFTYRDANLGNDDFLAQFLGMDAAGSLDEFIDVHRRANGVPWVNTIAASADGRTWYADTSATPNLPSDAIDRWQQAVATDGSLAQTVRDNGAVLLDGSDPGNEWIDDPAATRPGIVPFSQQPQLERSDDVFNANDSHWLANPAQLLTGFSPLMGPEAVPQSSRTRMNARLIADPDVRGADGLLDATEVEQALMSQRSLHAELLLPGLRRACERTSLVLVDNVPYDIRPACTVLAAWDGRYTADSVGPVLWREYLAQFDRHDRLDGGALYRVPFDPADPVGTPNTFNDDLDVVVLHNLGVAAKALVAAGHPIDEPLGAMQHDGRLGADALALPGGTNIDGTISVVDCCADSKTLAPTGKAPITQTPYRFTDQGYPVTNGNSFMMVVAFDADGPHARAVLTYGEPEDATEPGFGSQMALYAQGTLRSVAFRPDEVAADPEATTIEVQGDRQR